MKLTFLQWVAVGIGLGTSQVQRRQGDDDIRSELFEHIAAVAVGKRFPNERAEVKSSRALVETSVLKETRKNRNEGKYGRR